MIPTPVEFIQQTVAKAFSISAATMRSRPRPEHIAWPRQVAMYLARQHLPISSSAIGKAFGRDHSTVLFAVKRVRDRYEVEPETRRVIDAIDQTVQEGITQNEILHRL